MVLYTSTMVPSIVPKTSSTMLHERDSLAELTARENEVYQNLDKIRWFQWSGRIFGAERQQQQQQTQTETGNASHSSGSPLDGPDEGMDMQTEDTSDSISDDDDLFGDDHDGEIYIEGQQGLFDGPDDDIAEEFW